MPTFVDFAGMNTLVSSSIEGNTISSGRNTLISSINPEDELVGINLHRNGPYGYSSWKQLRVSENPVTRNHVANSTMTFVTEPGPIMNLGQNGELRIRSRYSAIYNYTEPAIAQKSYPLVWNVGRHFKDDDGQLAPEPQKFSILSSYANQQIGFANEKVDKLLKFDSDEEQTEYTAISDMYLENGLNKQDSPLTYWEFLQYRETVYPHMKNQFQNENLERPTFDSFYRHNRDDRTRLVLTNSYGLRPNTGTGVFYHVSKSAWPLDEAANFLTVTFGVPPASGAIPPSASINWQSPQYAPQNAMNGFGRNGEGDLMQTTSQYWGNMALNVGSSGLNNSLPNNVKSKQQVIDRVMAPGPLYARRVSLRNTASYANPSGMYIDETGSIPIERELDMLSSSIFQGGALWEAGRTREVKDTDGNYIAAPKEPFYDTYENYIEEVRKKHKNFSIVPEFRMSIQIEDYKRTNNAIELDMFDVTGGVSGTTDSSKENFYEIYSNSDFMRSFEVIDDDHKDFTNGKVLSLRCKAVKKFLPYEGFYPAQRTADLTKRFYDSFKNNIKLYNLENVEIDNFNYGRQMVMTPLFAPGILFNTIKSGVAVDYPVFTGSAITSTAPLDSITNPFTQTEFVIRDSNFDKRIPFETLVEPAKHLSNYKIVSNEPHPSGNLSASAEWDGQGDELYAMMTNNFLAESINFFLPNGQLTSLVSKKQKDIRLEQGKVYGMRIKMRKSMKGTRASVFHDGKPEFPYMPPQDIIKTKPNLESFTMYSRPSAFGPPTLGKTIQAGSADYNMFDEDKFQKDVDGVFTNLYMDSRFGFNYPFTPPYYHGESWCEVWLTASSDSMTIKEIQSAITSSFTRHDSTFMFDSGQTSFDGQGVQSLRSNTINKNALQLSASLNILGIGTTRPKNKSGGAGSLIVDSGAEIDNRWVIQTKFETPMLNFNHISAASGNLSIPVYGSASVPRGMWHQYGRIPEDKDGVFISVGAVPDNYQEVVRGVGSTYMHDLSEVLGFSGFEAKLGQVAPSKTISEAVVAVPFIEKEGGKKFFRLALSEEQLNMYKDNNIKDLTTGPPQSQIGRSVLLQLDKMKKFVFPPSFDFLNFDGVDPIAMYVFEFTHTLSQQDLSDIWQNLPPDIGTTMEVSEVAITHPLIQKELLGQGGEEGNQKIDMPDKLKWMVFKVKQRAATNYFKKTILRNPQVNTNVEDSDVSNDEFGDTSPIQYNWPYDFFSLVELVKIDAEVEMGNIDFSDYTDNMPAWDGVSADRDKIEQIVGGLEDDPIPEVQIPELMGQELAVSTQVFAGTDIEGRRKALGNNVVTGTTMAAGVQFGSQPGSGLQPREESEENDDANLEGVFGFTSYDDDGNIVQDIINFYRANKQRRLDTIGNPPKSSVKYKIAIGPIVLLAATATYAMYPAIALNEIKSLLKQNDSDAGDNL